MIQVMIAAPYSGSGKTTATCAMLRALKNRGFEPCAFKCGPDYIDPMFHRAVLGVESRNLDLFLSDEDCVRAQFRRGCTGHGAAVTEGVMGYYDGLGGVSDRASSWHVADTLDLPVILLMPAGGAGLTLAAQVRGLQAFRENSHIVGILLNECAPSLCNALTPVLERETGVAVLGCLPRMETVRLESRHLGLRTASEISDLSARLDTAAAALEQHLDWERFLSLCEREEACPAPMTSPKENGQVRIGFANDKAFCFTYHETLETLRFFGAELVPFSPLSDKRLPEKLCGLYLPGGYPELYAGELSANMPMRQSIAESVRGGLPTVAECGGFLYLGETLRDASGRDCEMVGVLPGSAANAGRLVRFGYETLCAETDSLLFRAGESVNVHEFHYWDSTDCGTGLAVRKGSRSWRCGFVSDTLYAAFPHLYFAGRPEMAERFVEAARHFGGGQ